MAQHVQEDIRTALIARTLGDAQVVPETNEYPQAEPAHEAGTPLSCYWYRDIDEATGKVTLRRAWWHRPADED